MKGLIFDIKRFAIHDGPGIRTTIFFKGCPLKCWWCHNPEGISSDINTYPESYKVGSSTFQTKESVGYEISVNNLLNEIVKDKIFMDESGGGITFSGGEPLYQTEFLIQILASCKKEKIHTAVDTSGFTSEDNLKGIIPYTDLFLFDVKHFDSKLHTLHTGVGNEIIKRNLKVIIQSGTQVIVRIPIIPEVNSSLQQNIKLSDELLALKSDNFNELHFLPYHKIGSTKYKRFNLVADCKEVDEPDKASMEVIANEYSKKGFITKIHR